MRQERHTAVRLRPRPVHQEDGLLLGDACPDNLEQGCSLLGITLRDFLVGVKLSYLRSAGAHGRLLRLFTDADLNVKVEAIKYQALTPLPPNSARSDAIVGALVVQVGALLRF